MIPFQPNSGPELVLSEEEQSDNEDKEETELGAMEDQRSVVLHLISQLKLGMDLTKVSRCGCAAVSVFRPRLLTWPLVVRRERGKGQHWLLLRIF